MIPAVMKIEAEDDEEEVGLSQVSPSGIHTRLSFIISMQDQSVSFAAAPLQVCVSVCVCKVRAHRGPDCLQPPPHR